MPPYTRTSRRQLLSRLAISLLPCPGVTQTGARPISRPVFEVDVPAPTKDKPQSKLWFAHGSWWAWLPVNGGSSIWRRMKSGWQRQSALDTALRGLPGQADVWAGALTVRTVLVEPRRLAVAALRWDAQRSQYRLDGEPAWFDPGAETETATIARDGSGRWWIAYNADRRMWVRSSLDGGNWTGPIEVTATPASTDDICAIVALPGETAVLWSDQDHDAVYFRRHRNSSPPDAWGEIEVVAQGGKTADDHIHIAALDNGALFVATKNSVDRIGEPQQVLRVRNAQGKWSNYPYATLTKTEAPTRPIAQLTYDGSRLFLLHTVALAGHRPARSVIVGLTTRPDRISLAGPALPLIEADAAVNNVTGSKARLPKEQPWIVLASDTEGRVYEALLSAGRSARAQRQVGAHA